MGEGAFVRWAFCVQCCVVRVQGRMLQGTGWEGANPVVSVKRGGPMIEEHDRVVLTTKESEAGLEPGDVGTVVHVYSGGRPSRLSSSPSRETPLPC
jgi:hypothetical protein